MLVAWLLGTGSSLEPTIRFFESTITTAFDQNHNWIPRGFICNRFFGGFMFKGKAVAETTMNVPGLGGLIKRH